MAQLQAVDKNRAIDRMIRAGIAYFLLVFGLGFALGGLRQALMGHGFERGLLVAAEVPLMLVFAWWASGWCASRFGVATTTAARLGMGVVMLLLLQAGELGVGVLLMGQTVQSHFAVLATASGMLEVAPQVLSALFPLLRARFSGR
jgi:hypothetical protein